VYELKPVKCYLLDNVRDDPSSMARAERILESLSVPMERVHVFAGHQAVDVVREANAWTPDTGTGIPWQHERSLVFTTIRIDETARNAPLPGIPDDVATADVRHVLGHLQLVRDTHPPSDDQLKNFVCWNTQDFGVMHGCPHGCQYCGVGKSAKMTVIGTNLEEYMEKVVGPTIEAHPGQKCFRLLGWTADIATFEPEYGAFESFLAKLAEYDDRYGYFHTAGNNVDWIAELPHRDRLIGVWSLTCATAARCVEPGSPSNEERVEAARKCQSWGLPVRFKFKPMIPVKNWREEYAHAIETIFRNTRPESLGFCILMWMNFERLAGMIDLDLLDPEYVEAARSQAGELRDIRTGPFPHELRAKAYRHLIREIREHDTDIPIYISTESREMWDELSDELGQNPKSFICGCNPIEAPGPCMLPSQQLAHSTY
jgi:DNA repair photolyase